MPGQPTQPELKADLAALPRRVPLVPERSDFIESMPRLRSGSRHSSPRRCCHRPRCSDHHTLRASVRHTDAFPNSARLVRVSCLECVFRVQRRRSRATESRQMVTIDRWFLSVCYPKPNSAGVRIAQRGLTAATKLEDWVDYAIRSDCALYSLAQFDNLAQKTRLSRLVVQRTRFCRDPNLITI